MRRQAPARAPLCRWIAMMSETRHNMAGFAHQAAIQQHSNTKAFKNQWSALEWQQFQERRQLERKLREKRDRSRSPAGGSDMNVGKGTEPPSKDA